MRNLDTTINKLYYGTIEDEIADFYDLGTINSSNLPIEFKEDEFGTFYIDGTKKSGDFPIRIDKQIDGKYSLLVSASSLKNK
ncbi:hypothetical protein [Tissierella pigra]|uniref:Uncharacterized protein n=1 Tax=Tissierella pigra TaxID=2607614 RepID=A0A6N7XLZ1_9FIRM|nr:hypothetical protein [Tissierella pigra]MSU03111.1 hypothetical protein [Tissierella pigra]